MTQSANANRAQLYQLIDVNLNRAAEGIRTVEDIARLTVRDASVSASLKGLRHALQVAVQDLSRPDLLASRSTHRDAGTGFTAGREELRTELGQIVAAACERTTQSLRVLEETTKIVAPSVAAEIKQLRYLAYDRLAHAELRLTKSAFPVAAKLYLLVDCSVSVEEFGSRLKRFSDAGVDIFQLRDKKADGRILAEYARCGVHALTGTNKLFIVNDRVDIALASGADGVHLGQDDLSIQDARSLLPAECFVGISTHDLEQVTAAVEAGADYIGCGPTFPSQTKRFDAFPGMEFLAQATQAATIPMFGIGGINLHNLSQVLSTGCSGVAIGSAINATANPFESARQFAAALAATAKA